MGTLAEVLIDGPSSLTPHAIGRLRELEHAWSRFRPDSELNRLHERAGDWFRVSHDLYTALRWCKRLYEETSGRFDPTVRSSLEQWGYDRTFRMIDESRPAPQWLHPAPGLAGVELRRADESARIEPGLLIDLGGVGKGLAADLVSAHLVALGAAGAYVSVGGDIAFAGEPPEGGWEVPLEDPDSGAPFAHHMLSGGGLVMSTTRLRRWRRAGGREAHHIIDPATGEPSETDLTTVAVAAASAARAEGLAKAALIAGRNEAGAMLRRAGVQAWLVGSAGITTVEDLS
jgi:thiamine biosynthesis lipoprotein